MEKASPSDGLQALVDFIAEAFDDLELTQFVRSLPEGSRLLLQMKRGSASSLEVADHLVVLLHRQGILDHQFFKKLARERPHRIDDVQLIARRYLPEAKTNTPEVGSLLCGGRYRLEQHINTGGFGVLWRAWDTVNDRAVAIKRLLRDIPDHEYAWRRAMFIRGASRMATIVHPCVAKVLLPHLNEDGNDYCVLEYVAGRSLHAEIKTGRLDSNADILRVLLHVGTGLAEIHTTGALHGDVSPKNIVTYLRGGAWHASLVDFDLVSAMDDDLFTMVGTGVLETDPYTAPEWKAPEGKLDGRVDVFGLGMTAVFALTREHLPKSLNDPRWKDSDTYIEQNLGKFSLDLRDVLRKACALRVEARHATMAEFCDELMRAGAPFLRAATASIAPALPVAAHHAPVPTAVPKQSPPSATAPIAPPEVVLPLLAPNEEVAPCLAPEPPVATAPEVEPNPPPATTEQTPRGPISSDAAPTRHADPAAPPVTNPVRSLRSRRRLVALVAAGLCTIPLIFITTYRPPRRPPDAPGEQQAAMTLNAPATPALITPVEVTKKPAGEVPVVSPQRPPDAPIPQAVAPDASPTPKSVTTELLVTEPAEPEMVAPEPSPVTKIAMPEPAKRPGSGRWRIRAKPDAPRPAPTPSAKPDAPRPTPTPPATPPPTSMPSLTCNELRAKVLGLVAQECKKYIDIHVRNGEPATMNLSCPYAYDANIGVTVGRCKSKSQSQKEDIVRNCVLGRQTWTIIVGNVSQVSSCPNPIVFEIADGVPR